MFNKKGSGYVVINLFLRENFTIGGMNAEKSNKRDEKILHPICFIDLSVEYSFIL